MIYHSYQRATNLYESIYGRFEYPVEKFRKKHKLTILSNVSHELTNVSLDIDWFCSNCRRINKSKYNICMSCKEIKDKETFISFSHIEKNIKEKI